MRRTLSVESHRHSIRPVARHGLPGVAPRLRRRATRRLRRLSLPSPPPAVWTPAASYASASPDAVAAGFPPAFSEEVSGRVASRPGFPFQSPLAALAPISTAIPRAFVRFAHCAVPLPGGSLRSPPPACPPPSRIAPTLRSFRRCRLSAWALCARRASAPRPDRSRAAAAPLRFRSRNRNPHR